jgi:hypothetical protein
LGKLDNESYPHLQSKDQKDFEGLSESEMIALAGTWIKEIQFGASST